MQYWKLIDILLIENDCIKTIDISNNKVHATIYTKDCEWRNKYVKIQEVLLSNDVNQVPFKL